MMTELKILNDKMARQNRKICLLMDHAPCHLISNEPIPDFPNIKIAYVGRCMTDKLQPLDNCIIAVLKNKYKKWLNLELFKNERLSKFDKIKKRQKFFIQFDQKLDSSVGIIRFFEGMDKLMSLKRCIIRIMKLGKK